jgi:hypothetical protein
MRPRRIVVVALVIVTGLGAFSWHTYKCRRHSKILSLLREGQLPAARAELNGYHDWDEFLRQIERAHDPALAQAALDVQFEWWYSDSDDTNYAYEERPAIVQSLLAQGATPRFQHLLEATKQGKVRVARLLLDTGVPAQIPNASDTPLANAAYWGDVDLVADLLRNGADPNRPSGRGWRPILAAAWSYRVECVRYLLDHGADVSLPYEVWDGNVQPIWKVIEERAANGSEAAAVWAIVRDRVPASKPEKKS